MESFMMEQSYPKARKQPPLKETCDTIVDYDFMSRSSFQPTAEYIKEAKELLSSDFPFLSKAGIDFMFKSTSVDNHYAIVHDKIVTALFQEDVVVPTAAAAAAVDSSCAAKISKLNAKWDNLVRVFTEKNIDSSQTKLIEQIKLSMTPSAPHSLNLTKQWRGALPSIPSCLNPILAAEVQYVTIKLDDLLDMKWQQYQRQINKARAEHEGIAVECQCCYDNTHMADMITCVEKGHYFCFNCMQAQAENLLFGNANLGVHPKTKKLALELLCFHSSGCTSGFERKELDIHLPKTLMKKYDEIQFQISLNHSGLAGDIAACPKCHFQALVHASNRVFVCPVASCGFESCRDCGEEAHIPLRCDEVEKEHETVGRLTVEEAVSAAKIRVCPDCKKGYVKR
jgi:hypothetical protein